MNSVIREKSYINHLAQAILETTKMPKLRKFVNWKKLGIATWRNIQFAASGQTRERARGQRTASLDWRQSLAFQDKKKIGVNRGGKPRPHWHLVIIYWVKVHRLTPEIRLAHPYMELLWNVPSKMPSVTFLKLCCGLLNELCTVQWTKYIILPPLHLLLHVQYLGQTDSDSGPNAMQMQCNVYVDGTWNP